jgi:hypothetical protein
MGLYIDYRPLKDYLVDSYADSENPAKLAGEALRSLHCYIEKQTGKSVNFSSGKIRKQLPGFKFGSYSEIHYLRAFASIISGYTLEEAYEIPLEEINLLESETSSSLCEAGVAGGEKTFDKEFEAEWGTKLSEILPKRKRKQRPFPFYNLVCFSDSEGIYVPEYFMEPIVVDKTYIGSAKRLSKELDELGIIIAEKIAVATKKRERILEHYLFYVRQLWWRLRDACENSMKNETSLVFC